jgi:anti-sigma B factor antagonist
MNPPSAKMLVSVGDKCACIRISGKANFTSSIDFKTLFDELWQKGCNYFILDLTECVLMDSTFLGVLAGYGLRISTLQPAETKRTLELYRPSERIVDLLENLGVLHLFKVTQDDTPLPQCATETRDVTHVDTSREEVQRTCLEAHQLLMQINPANVAKFKDVAAFLAEDLKRMKGGG